MNIERNRSALVAEIASDFIERAINAGSDHDASPSEVSEALAMTLISVIGITGMVGAMVKNDFDVEVAQQKARENIHDAIYRFIQYLWAVKDGVKDGSFTIEEVSMGVQLSDLSPDHLTNVKEATIN